MLYYCVRILLINITVVDVYFSLGDFEKNNVAVNFPLILTLNQKILPFKSDIIHERNSCEYELTSNQELTDGSAKPALPHLTAPDLSKNLNYDPVATKDSREINANEMLADNERRHNNKAGECNQPVTYELVSVLRHLGVRAGRGHYISDVRVPKQIGAIKR